MKEHGLSLDDIGFEVQTHLKKYSRVVMYNADFHKRFFPNYWLTDKVVICAMQWSLAYINNHPSYEHLSTYLKLPVLAALLEVDPLYNDPDYDLEIDLEWGEHTSLNQCKLIRKVWLKMAKTAYQLDNKIGFELLDSTNTLLPTS